MKNLITILLVVIGLIQFHADGMAESPTGANPAAKLTHVEAELKQVKTELELAKVKLQLKDKKIELLKQKFAEQCKRLVANSRKCYSSSRRRTTNSSSYNSAAQQAAQKAAQKKEKAAKNARLLKYCLSEKTSLARKIKSAEKDLKLAKGTIGKTNRQYKIRQCESKLNSLYYQQKKLVSKIKKLKYGVYN